MLHGLLLHRILFVWRFEYGHWKNPSINPWRMWSNIWLHSIVWWRGQSFSYPFCVFFTVAKIIQTETNKKFNNRPSPRRFSQVVGCGWCGLLTRWLHDGSPHPSSPKSKYSPQTLFVFPRVSFKEFEFNWHRKKEKKQMPIRPSPQHSCSPLNITRNHLTNSAIFCFS